MDLDGDGISTWGDRYAFNYWLGRGGSLGSALASAETEGGTIDVSAFFSGPASALSPDAAVIYAEKPVPLDAPPGPCSTAARISAYFNGGPGVTQVACVCEGDVLSSSSGHALMEIPGATALFIGKHVWGGGIAWVTFYDPADGNLPLGADRFGLLDGLLEEPLEEISNVAQVVWDRKVWLEEGRRELLFTQHVDVPGYSTVVRVYRASPPGTLAWSHEEFGYGLLEYAFGLAILPPELDCEAQGLGDPGHLLIAEDRPQAALPGRLKRYGDDLCGEGTLQYLLDAYRNPTQGFDHLQGIAVHAPQGGSALPLGIYVAERGAGRILRFSGPPIAWYEMSVFQQAAASQPAHVLVHEPYLFVSEDRPDGKIRRLKATGSYTNLPFVEGAQNPHGMTVLPSGVLVFSEGDVVKGRLVAVDGWKYRFNRGDANGDGAINISDAVFVQAYLFLGGPAPGCFDAADVNDDSRVSLSDSVYLLNYLFQGGDPPPAPFYGEHPSPGQCGWDPTIDLLGCLSFGVSGCAIRP